VLSVYGNQLKIKFRSLHIRELDALYAEAFVLTKKLNLQTSADYYEQLNRLRVALQLCSITGSSTPLHISLPEGLDPSTHPEAASHWSTFFEEDPKRVIDPTSSLVSKVYDYVIANVVKTEHMHRTITHTCKLFNQLVVKLEVNVSNTPFWNVTAQP
jgi:hypothetical protein